MFACQDSGQTIRTIFEGKHLCGSFMHLSAVVCKRLIIKAALADKLESTIRIAED
jgi:hypothetical protein